MQLGLRLAETDDPDLKKATYGLFAALSTVMKEEISGFLPKIIELMIESLKSSDGITVSTLNIVEIILKEESEILFFCSHITKMTKIPLFRCMKI